MKYKSSNNYLIYAFYDRMGIIDFHIIESLKKYSKFFTIIFVSNISIKKKEQKKISFVEKVIVSEHNEMDFGSWKVGLEFIKKKKKENILLINDSVIGPFMNLNLILENIKFQKCDFWGITSAGKGKNYHIQSYFIFFKKKCLSSKFFKDFFSGIKKVSSKSELVRKYEIGLTQGLLKNGMKCNTLLTNCSRDLFADEKCIDLFLNRRLPFFKVKNIVSNPYRLKRMNKVFEILRPKCRYVNYIKRVNNNDSLIHLNFFVPQFKKIIFSKYFCLIRSKIVFKNKIWRFYIKFLGIYIFFFLLPISQNLNKLYKSDSNYKN